MNEPDPGAERAPVLRRTIEFETYEDGDDLEVVARIQDTRPWAVGLSHATLHDMTLTVRVDDTMMITEVTATMAKHPHTECPRITTEAPSTPSREWIVLRTRPRFPLLETGHISTRLKIARPSWRATTLRVLNERGLRCVRGTWWGRLPRPGVARTGPRPGMPALECLAEPTAPNPTTVGWLTHTCNARPGVEDGRERLGRNTYADRRPVDRQGGTHRCPWRSPKITVRSPRWRARS